MDYMYVHVHVLITIWMYLQIINMIHCICTCTLCILSLYIFSVLNVFLGHCKDYSSSNDSVNSLHSEFIRQVITDSAAECPSCV